MRLRSRNKRQADRRNRQMFLKRPIRGTAFLELESTVRAAKSKIKKQLIASAAKASGKHPGGHRHPR
jgi:hypothetical protein